MPEFRVDPDPIGRLRVGSAWVEKEAEGHGCLRRVRPLYSNSEQTRARSDYPRSA